MKNPLFYYPLQKVFLILLATILFVSCSKNEPLSPDAGSFITLKSGTSPDCQTDCIVPGSGEYFAKSGSASKGSGKNSKLVTYSAYNTEDSFVVNVTYKITSGNSKAQSTITVVIDGQSRIFEEVSSGITVTHSVELPEGWMGCDLVGFTILQEGLAAPIIISGEYALIPVCTINEVPFVIIGGQTWMQKNLDVSTYRNGDPILHAQTNAEWIAAGINQTGAWCYYENDPANGEIYGKIYNGYAVVDPRGLAPEGWYIPSRNEWNDLVGFLGGEVAGAGYFAARKMKHAGLEYWSHPNYLATNESGFTGLPAGIRITNGEFIGLKDLTYYWTSTVAYGTNVASWVISLYYANGPVGTEGFLSTYGASVRCLEE